MPITLVKYATSEGQVPLDSWLDGLRDRRARARVLVRLDRLELGLEGHWRSVGDGVRELKIPEGKGYRVYYAWDGTEVVVLLCGGDKSSQSRGIETAIAYWRDYNARR